LPRPVVERERCDRQDVRGGLIEDERLLERDTANGVALRAEPTLPFDRPPVESFEGGLDLGAGGSGDRYSPVLIITCLMNV
jgi:hypothetical protein